MLCHRRATTGIRRRRHGGVRDPEVKPSGLPSGRNDDDGLDLDYDRLDMYDQKEAMEEALRHSGVNAGKRIAGRGAELGPEGDFTPAEVNDILSSGVHPITLGQVILRSETAALYTISALNYEMQSPRG